MTSHHYTEHLYLIQQGRYRVLRTRGGLTPYLKLGGCAAVLLMVATHDHSLLARFDRIVRLDKPDLAPTTPC